MQAVRACFEALSLSRESGKKPMRAEGRGRGESGTGHRHHQVPSAASSSTIREPSAARGHTHDWLTFIHPPLTCIRVIHIPASHPSFSPSSSPIRSNFRLYHIRWVVHRHRQIRESPSVPMFPVPKKVTRT
ncbi:unnamed protein product [Cercospora beticola]|nr:unnamed protein product [Cercospora beticola]